MRSVAPLLIATATACGGTDVGPWTPSEPAPDLDDSAAWIRVSLATYEDGGSTYVTGNLITDPPLWPYDVEPVDGACRFSTRQAGECVPFCEWNEACVGGVCIAPPLVRSAGLLMLEAGDTSLPVPFSDGFYQHFDQTLAFAPGALVSASAPGDVLAAFSTTAIAPQPLALIGADELRLRAGDPLTIRWEPDDPGARVRVTLGADQGHAFFRPVVVECDAPDEHGGIEIPQHMVDRLADGDNWGCGDCFSQEVRRYRRGRTMADTVPIDLWLNQIVSLYLVPEP
jgi:hypothetical protein